MIWGDTSPFCAEVRSEHDAVSSHPTLFTYRVEAMNFSELQIMTQAEAKQNCARNAAQYTFRRLSKKRLDVIYSNNTVLPFMWFFIYLCPRCPDVLMSTLPASSVLSPKVLWTLDFSALSRMSQVDSRYDVQACFAEQGVTTMSTEIAQLPDLKVDDLKKHIVARTREVWGVHLYKRHFSLVLSEQNAQLSCHEALESVLRTHVQPQITDLSRGVHLCVRAIPTLPASSVLSPKVLWTLDFSALSRMSQVDSRYDVQACFAEQGVTTMSTEIAQLPDLKVDDLKKHIVARTREVWGIHLYKRHFCLVLSVQDVQLSCQESLQHVFRLHEVLRGNVSLEDADNRDVHVLLHARVTWSTSTRLLVRWDKSAK